MFEILKRRKKKEEPDVKFVKLNSDTDYRFVSPIDANEIDLSEISHESNMKLLNSSKPDDRVPNYRDALIKAHLKTYAEYLDRHKKASNRLWEEIKIGAKVQAEMRLSEIEFINSIDIDELFKEEF